MKKFLIVIVLVLVGVGLFANSYTIETSRGTQILELPEGYSFEEAFVEMAKLYLEERFDHEDILVVVNDLNLKVEYYMKRVDELNTKNNSLSERYANLNDLYKRKAEKDLFKPSMSLGYVLNMTNMSSTYLLSFGGTVYNRISLHTILSYPLGLGISIGVQFDVR